jgi:hypothetical protein
MPQQLSRPFFRAPGDARTEDSGKGSPISNSASFGGGKRERSSGKKPGRQTTFFLKVVFVLGRCGRRARRDSFLSFRSLTRMPSSHPGGDPFSHPSGASVSRPVRVPDRSAPGRLAPARRARPPPGRPGARKRSVPSRVHSVGSNGWLARPSGGTSNFPQTRGSVESP